MLILTESAIANNINEIIIKNIWNKVLYLPYQKAIKIYKAKKFIDKWIQLNGLNKLQNKKEILINDDKRWRNQLLITGINPEKISLIEDGMGAYIRNDYSFREKIYRGIILKYLFRDRLINTKNISSIPADEFYAFRKTAYPWFGPNRKLHLLNYNNSKYIQKINKRGIVGKQKEIIKNADVTILTSPIVEDQMLTLNEEMMAWEYLRNYFKNKETIAIKPHPRESIELSKKREQFISKVFKESKIIKLDSILPAEILLCDDNVKSDVFGPNSTTLVNMKSIRPDLKIYHGCELFKSEKKSNSTVGKLANYFDEMGVSSITKISISVTK